jgi:tripartite-type tricarboxylate transporter receptor subunit TctC
MNTFSKNRRTLVQAGAFTASAMVAPSLAWAQAGWPSRPVRLIVNFAPGSSPDVVGRALVQPLQEALGQPVIVENRAGASGNVGAEAVVKSNADGHTLLVTAGSTISIGPLINAVPFDVNRDLTPVAAIARLSVFLVSRADLPPKTVKELVDYMKARPGKLSYGSSGSGSSLHIAGEMFKSQAGVFAVHVPYRGAAPSLQDLLAGHLDYAMDPGIAFPHVRSGRLRLLAVGTLQRASLFPDVPTLDEAGFKGFDAGTTHSVYAPAGTPADVIARLNREINQALSAPAVKAAITNIGAEPSPMSPAQLNAIMQSDNRRYAAIIKERNIKPD